MEQLPKRWAPLRGGSIWLRYSALGHGYDSDKVAIALTDIARCRRRLLSGLLSPVFCGIILE